MKKNFANFDKVEGPFTFFKSLLDIPATDIDGRHLKKLGEVVKDKRLILVVNVASKSPLAKKTYTQLESLYREY